MATHIDVNGKWFNQHGSEIDLKVDEAGRIRGVFRSSVGFPRPDEAFEVTGYVDGELVAFVVRFGNYDSITSWTGHAGDPGGKDTIYCLWHMSVGLPPGHEKQLWQGTWSGADVFLRDRVGDDVEPHPTKPSHPIGDEIPVA